MSDEEECTHESWECMYGSHTCTDCREYLGNKETFVGWYIESFDLCPVCGPHVEHEGWPCTLPHHCRYKSGAEEVSKQQDEMDVPQGRSSQYITKDSGKREEYNSGMRRDTQEGKARFELLLVPGLPFEEQFLTRLGQLLARGAGKYGDRNWEKANSPEELERFVSSGLRHMVQWASGEVDEDHAAAVAFNLMAAEYVKWKLANEDPAL